MIDQSYIIVGMFAATQLLVLVGTVISNKLETRVLKTEFGHLQTSVRKLDTVLIRLAASDEKLRHTEDRILAEGTRLDELERRFNRMIDHKVITQFPAT